MNQPYRRRLTLGSAILCTAGAAAAQTTYSEQEPNGTKAEANIISMHDGDTIIGTTTGSILAPGDTSPASADTFHIRTSALSPGIYVHRIAIGTVGPVGHTGTIRGLSQIGGIPQPGSDVAAQTCIVGTQFGSAWVQWYAFGRAEEFYFRVEGTAATPNPYFASMSTNVINTVTVPATFAPGLITITAENQGHTTDTEFWIYDANLRAIPGFGNDDTPPGFPGAGIGHESTLRAAFAPGTYFLAITNSQYVNDQAAPPNDLQTGNVLEFPDVSVNGPADVGVPLAMTFGISDGVTTTQTPAFKAERFQIVWFQFTVGAATPPTPYCFGDTGNCPCGNVGAAGNGCPSSLNPAGARLAGSGNPSLSADTLVLTGTGMPDAFALYFQGTTQSNGGIGSVFGDGLRCAEGAVTRLAKRLNVGGTSSFPSATDPSVHLKGGVTAGGTIHTYQCWYRNAATFCNVDTFNWTNGLSVTWIP